MYRLPPLPHFFLTCVCIGLILVAPIHANSPKPIDYSASIQVDIINEIRSCAASAQHSEEKLMRLITTAECMAEKRDDDDLNVIAAAGRLAIRQPSAAVEVLRRICDGTPSNRLDAWLLLSVAQRVQGNFDEAISAAQVAARSAPTNADIQLQLLLCYAEGGDEFEKVIALDRLKYLRPEIDSVPTMDPVTGGVICVVVAAITSIYYMDVKYNDGKNASVIVHEVFGILQGVAFSGVAKSITNQVSPMLESIRTEWNKGEGK